LDADTLIRAQGISFSYDGRPAIQDATFHITGRPFLSIIGPNGGGKSTLVKLMAGLLNPDRGSIEVLGQAPAQARRRIGYMPQHVQIDPRFPVTVHDVVLMGRADRHWYGWYLHSDKEAATRALEEVGLAPLAGRPFHALSGGERQRVLIARALACEPDLLLLDEPTANVDVASESRFIEVLQHLNQRMPVAVVSHDLGFVAEAVELVICVNRTVHVHKTSDITGELIKELYGEPVRAVDHHHSFKGNAHG
jgi:zinc transport system ATP-binding protein